MATHLVKFGIVSFCDQKMTKNHDFTNRIHLVDCKRCLYSKIRGDLKPPAPEVIRYCHNRFKIPKNIDYMRFSKWKDEETMDKVIRAYDLDVLYTKAVTSCLSMP